MADTANANAFVDVMINGVTVKLAQGTNSFKDIVARGARVGACSVGSSLITVTAKPTTPSSLNANGSFPVQGGESFTIA